jgi:HSP20 family protein
MQEIVFKPRIDIVDTGVTYEVTLELPGVELRDVRTTLHQGVLAIEGEKKRRASRLRSANLTVTERNFGRFRREIALDVPPEISAFETQFEKGVLKITIAKTLGPSPEEVLFKKSKRKPRGFLRNLLGGRKATRRPYPYFED